MMIHSKQVGAVINRRLVLSSLRRRQYFCTAALSTFQKDHNANNTGTQWDRILLGSAAVIAGATVATATTTFCDSAEATTTTTANTKSGRKGFTPSSVASEDFEKLQLSHDDIDNMPVYTVEQLAENDGTDGKPVWMSYGGVIYDVTEFIANHPGGSEKILMAAGSHIEPFWYIYRQHYTSDLPMRLMEHMAIGRLQDSDQDAVNEQLATLEENDPYCKEPLRHRSLIVHGDMPMNAEVPVRLLTESYITPTSLCYIRHHHPVPLLSDLEAQDYKLHIDLSAAGGPSDYAISLRDLKEMEKEEIIVTLQCSGNRRSGFNYVLRTSGTSWGQGAISTAKFGGVRLRDVLKKAGLDDPIKAEEEKGIQHVVFHSIDGMASSIGIEKAVNPYGDCIIAYEMNDEMLSREHGYPLRIIVPGYSGIRNVKWINKIVLSPTDADSPFNRGINYKILPPGVTDANNIDLTTMPSVMESSVFSGITTIEQQDSSTSSSSTLRPGDVITVKVGGWAWAGGGRNIVRVDLSGDDGTTWATATLKEGSNQKFGRAWAWTFWECQLPVKVKEDGTVHVASKAIDSAFNVQPEKCDPIWNFRGLCNNSWYRAHVKVV